MQPNPLTPVLQRLDNDPPVFFADQACHELGESWGSLLAHGLLRDIQPSNSARCEGCGIGFANRIEWMTDKQSGKAVAYMPCPECGPVRISADNLRRSAVDIPRLLAALLHAAQGRGTPEETIPGHLWHLGRVLLCRRWREAYFVRCINDRNRPAVKSALTTHAKALLFFPTEASAHRWGAATQNPVVALESVVSLGAEGISFDPVPVEAKLADAGFVASHDAQRKKPLPKRATRAEKIARLTEEVIKLLRTAREHAFSSLELTGTAELLPRPTQQQLGEMCGLDEYDVTRCFGDDTARELRLYWDMALDIDQVMKFAGPISGGSIA
jgi:hypothetical protein